MKYKDWKLDGPVVWPDINGIKCDEPHCTYRATGVDVADYPKWLEEKCPHCGGPLLTEADNKAVLKLLRRMHWLNQIVLWMPLWVQWQIILLGNHVSTELRMNGTGIIRIGEIKGS